MIKKSLFYSIILLACFTAHDALSVGPSADIFILVPIAGAATVGAFISASKIGKLLQPAKATFGSTVISYAIGGSIGFTVCFVVGVKLFKHYDKKIAQECWKRIEKEKQKDLNDSAKNHYMD